MTITNLIDQALKEKQDKRKDRKSSGLISPSGFGSCFRKQIWKRQGKEPSNPIDSRTLRVFECGHIFHNWVQGLLGEIESEVRCEKEDILGYADIVTEDEVIDLKTTHSRGFWYMKKDGYDVNKEKYGNILQVVCYAWMLNKPKVRLCFVSKDDLCINEYVFYTDKWVDKVLTELSSLRQWWEKAKSGKTPPPEPRAFKTECKYCIYQNACKEELCKQSKT